MHRILKMALVSALLPSVLPAADEAFLFQGRLSTTGGAAYSNSSAVVEFNLYTNKTGGASLWARRIPVSLSATGVFGVELSDSAGTAVPGGPSGGLAEALAAGRTATVYVGLKVQGVDREFPNRVPLGKVPAADCAISARQPLDADFKVGGDIAAERFEPAGNVSVSNVSVRGGTEIGKITCGRVAVGGIVDAKKDLKVGQSVFARNVSFGGGLVANGAASAERVTVRSADFTVNGKPPLSYIGMIVLWAGAPDKVPPGWEICDGRLVNVDGRSVRMPDFTGRFAMGTKDDKDINGTGGARTVSLTVAQLPKHVHTFEFGTQGYAGGWTNGGKYLLRTEPPGTNFWDSAGYNTDGGVKDQPAGAAHENLPPYYALYYIMKVR